MQQIEQYRPFELTLNGKADGNPFVDVRLTAVFSFGNEWVTVRGFYDGDGRFVIRYMPQRVGLWRYRVSANIVAFDGRQGEFECVPAQGDNHGPVAVYDKVHFAYADGTPFLPFGTTAYAWLFQDESVKQNTLNTLAQNRFNKIRMCVFPKFYNYNTPEPPLYPFAGEQTRLEDSFNPDSWQVEMEKVRFDFTTFSPAYFQMIERAIRALDDIGVEVDLILFHPYDHWGFARMSMADNRRYLEYIVARFASFKNIWWSLANEFDLMQRLGQRQYADWDTLCQTVRREDPSGHLLSIHNFYDPPEHKHTTANWYDHTKPWITHLSIQTDNLFFVPRWRAEYQKPIVIDECRYEGNIELAWGNMSAQGMTDSFWRVVCRGGYATHGETYIDKPYTTRPIWWSHGNVLRGESHRRINFFYDLLVQHGIHVITPIATTGPHWELAAGQCDDYSKVLIYFGDSQPEFEQLDFLPDGLLFNATLIDTWNMTTQPFDTVISNQTFFRLPQGKYQALLLEKKEAA